MAVKAQFSLSVVLRLVSALLLGLTIASPQAIAKPSVLEPEAIEAAGAVIRDVVLDRQNVFNLGDPKEDRRLYRLANRLHVVTREEVIRGQLLFQPGDRFDARLLEETERILRRNEFFIDATVRPIAFEGGMVDIEVVTEDVWSLTPKASFSRSGGENRVSLGAEEVNLLGNGQFLRARYLSNVDRDSTQLEFEDRTLNHGWWGLLVRAADNSDGDSALISLERPFPALDARWSAGLRFTTDDRVTPLYSLGDENAEFRHERDFHRIYGGWSMGLKSGWVHRWTAGYIHDDNRFSAPLEPDPDRVTVIPTDRNLRYPFIGLEILEDNFEKAENVNVMGRTEDVLLGARLAATLGYSSTTLGADRNAWVASAQGSVGFGSLNSKALLLGFNGQARLEDGDLRNARLRFDARYYRRQSDRRTFFVEVSGTAGDNLDLDDPIELGGRTGLRGYPLRYQGGDAKAVLSVEQRWFTNKYPFRLFRLGAAVFADVGRAWGENPIGEENQGWLRDVGFGLRIAPVRASRRIVHIDFAFPLDGDSSIDSVQVLFRARSTF